MPQAQVEAANPQTLHISGEFIESNPGSAVEADGSVTVRAIGLKLHPYFSAFGALSVQLDQAGADGLVLFNRLCHPDIDLVQLRWSNDIALSDADEIRLGLLLDFSALREIGPRFARGEYGRADRG
jgi:hypothetical protein